MTTHRNGFEGQTNGTPVTVANSALSGSAFTAVTPGAGGSIVYSNAHPGDGSMGIAFTGSGTAACYVEDASFNSTSIEDEFVFWFDGNPPTATSGIQSIRSPAGQHFGLNINTGKQIIITSPTGTVLGSFATVLTAGFWRIDVQGTSDAAAGTVNAQLYSGAQLTTPVETKALSALNTRGGNMTLVRHGITSTTNFGSTFHIDSIQTADGTTTPAGPFPANVAPTASFTHSETGLSTTVTSTSTDTDGTITAYDWNWGDGTTHGTGASATHAYATAGTRTVTLTITDNAGGTATATASVTTTAPNAAPTANAGADQTVDPALDATFTLTGAGSDSDGTIASYLWEDITGTPAVVAGAGASRTITTPTSLAGSTLTYRLTVTDNSGATGTDTVVITVRPHTYRRCTGPGTWVPIRRRPIDMQQLRGLAYAGDGTGTTADRDLLLTRRTGPAKDATGGYAGPTYTVTTLTDSGVGSLRYGVEGTGLTDPNDPRWIVFDKSVFPSDTEKTITLTSALYFRANKTIDGRGSKVKIVSSNGLNIQGTGNPANAATSFVRLPGGLANSIMTHFTMQVDTVSNNRDCITCSDNWDLVWGNHLTLFGASDGLIDMTAPQNRGVNNLGTSPTESRASWTWVREGPHPTTLALSKFPLSGGDNLPENGKANLVGLAGDPDDAIKVLFDHCLWRGTVQRNPKVWNGANVHVINSFIDRWGFVPGIAGTDAEVAYYAGIGKTAIKATYGTEGSAVDLRGKLLVENTTYRSYAADEAHLLTDTPAGAWPVHFPDTRAIRVVSTIGTGGLRTSGLRLLGGATVDADTGVVAAPSYPYQLLTANDQLLADLELGTGNYQPA